MVHNIVNLPLCRLLRYDFLEIVTHSLPVWPASKGQIGVTILYRYLLTINGLYNAAKSFDLPHVVVEI